MSGTPVKDLIELLAVESTLIYKQNIVKAYNKIIYELYIF